MIPGTSKLYLLVNRKNNTIKLKSLRVTFAWPDELKYVLRYAYTFAMLEKMSVPGACLDKKTVGTDWWPGFVTRNNYALSFLRSRIKCATCQCPLILDVDF